MMVASSGFEFSTDVSRSMSIDFRGGVASPKFGAARPCGGGETSKPR